MGSRVHMHATHSSSATSSPYTSIICLLFTISYSLSALKNVPFVLSSTICCQTLHSFKSLHPLRPIPHAQISSRRRPSTMMQAIAHSSAKLTGVQSQMFMFPNFLAAATDRSPNQAGYFILVMTPPFAPSTLHFVLRLKFTPLHHMQ